MDGKKWKVYKNVPFGLKFMKCAVVFTFLCLAFTFKQDNIQMVTELWEFLYEVKLHNGFGSNPHLSIHSLVLIQLRVTGGLEHILAVLGQDAGYAIATVLATASLCCHMVCCMFFFLIFSLLCGLLGFKCKTKAHLVRTG